MRQSKILLLTAILLAISQTAVAQNNNPSLGGSAADIFGDAVGDLGIMDDDRDDLSENYEVHLRAWSLRLGHQNAKIL